MVDLDPRILRIMLAYLAGFPPDELEERARTLVSADLDMDDTAWVCSWPDRIIPVLVDEVARAYAFHLNMAAMPPPAKA